MRNGLNFKKDVRKYGDKLAALQSVPEGESLTRQDHAAACNINAIYAKTQRGEIVLSSSVMPEYGEFNQLDGYDVALEKIMEAEDSFMQLPATVRKLYNNDPKEYYDKMLEQAQGKFDADVAEKEAQLAKQKLHEQKEQARELLKDEIQTESD